jgi:hypothetical protein
MCVTIAAWCGNQYQCLNTRQDPSRTHGLQSGVWGRVRNVDFMLVIVFDAELQLRFSRMIP